MPWICLRCGSKAITLRGPTVSVYEVHQEWTDAGTYEIDYGNAHRSDTDDFGEPTAAECRNCGCEDDDLGPLGTRKPEEVILWRD